MKTLSSMTLLLTALSLNSHAAEPPSLEKMWENQKCGMVVASAIVRAAKAKKIYEALFGIGGGHYAREFNKIVLETDYAVGHIAPKYVLDEMRTEMMQEALEKRRVDEGE